MATPQEWFIPVLLLLLLAVGIAVALTWIKVKEIERYWKDKPLALDGQGPSARVGTPTMNLVEAVQRTRMTQRPTGDGYGYHAVRRRAWTDDPGYILIPGNEMGYLADEDGCARNFALVVEDVLAYDWEVLDEIPKR